MTRAFAILIPLGWHENLVWEYTPTFHYETCSCLKTFARTNAQIPSHGAVRPSVVQVQAQQALAHPRIACLREGPRAAAPSMAGLEPAASRRRTRTGTASMDVDSEEFDEDAAASEMDALSVEDADADAHEVF